MAKINDIKITENDLFKKAKDPKYKSVIDTITRSGRKLEQMLPKNNHHYISIEIGGFRESLVSLLRAILLDGLEVKTLTFDFSDEKSFYCDDKSILCDVVQHRIEALVLDQNIGDDITGSLEMTNDSDILKTITTDSLQFSGKWKNTFPKTTIAHLHPKKTLKINNIYVEKGYAITNARKFTIVNSVGFKCLDVAPLGEKGGISSLKSKPMVHRLTYNTYRNNTPPLWPLERAFEEILKSLNSIKSVVENNKVEINK